MPEHRCRSSSDSTRRRKCPREFSFFGITMKFGGSKGAQEPASKCVGGRKAANAPMNRDLPASGAAEASGSRQRSGGQQAGNIHPAQPGSQETQRREEARKAKEIADKIKREREEFARKEAEREQKRKEIRQKWKKARHAKRDKNEKAKEAAEKRRRHAAKQRAELTAPLLIRGALNQANLRQNDEDFGNVHRGAATTLLNRGIGDMRRTYIEGMIIPTHIKREQDEEARRAKEAPKRESARKEAEGIEAASKEAAWREPERAQPLQTYMNRGIGDMRRTYIEGMIMPDESKEEARRQKKEADKREREEEEARKAAASAPMQIGIGDMRRTYIEGMLVPDAKRGRNGGRRAGNIGKR